MAENRDFLLFSGTSHREFAERVATCLGVPLGKVLLEMFPDGEIGAQVLESVRGRDVFVLQSIARHPNFYLMELLILIDALRRASARSIIAVLPYYGYARQDRRGKGREPITAKLVADLLETAGVTRVLTMDLHAEQIQGFFSIPVDNLYARPVLLESIRKMGLEQCVVVAPDVGSIKLARAFSESLKGEFAIVDKRRVNAKQVELSALIGDVKDRDVLLVDDMCSTGSTLKTAAQVCRQFGAKRVCAAVTHGLFVGERIANGVVERMLVSDTVPPTEEILRDWIEVVSVAGLFAKAIDSIVGAKSISSLFRTAP